MRDVCLYNLFAYVWTPYVITRQIRQELPWRHTLERVRDSKNALQATAGCTVYLANSFSQSDSII